MRPRRSKPSGSRSLPHRETPTHRLGLTAEKEHAFYADPANQVSKGPSVRRRRRLSEPVPVRFPETLLAEVRERAAADDRSVSNWIRRAVVHGHEKVEHELRKNAREPQPTREGDLRFPLRVEHHGAPTFQMIAHEPRPSAVLEDCTHTACPSFRGFACRVLPQLPNCPVIEVKARLRRAGGLRAALARRPRPQGRDPSTKPVSRPHRGRHPRTRQLPRLSLAQVSSRAVHRCAEVARLTSR